MTTHRHRGDRSLRGVDVHPHITTAADHITPLLNDVLRGKFRRPDGTRVVLAAGPRCALYALLSYGTELKNPAYRLKMDDFVGDFKEKQDTVYKWIRTLEDEGFVRRWRGNDPDTGKFVWHLSVWDSPLALATVTDVNPQVNPSLQKGGDGAAPPVDNSENRRSDHPYDLPGWQKPSMEKPDTATSYRETISSYVPASPPVSDAREDQKPEEGEEPFATTRPPRLVSIVWTDRTEDEATLRPGDEFVRFIASLVNAPECQGALMPHQLAQETLAIRAQVAHEQRGWSFDQLRRYLLGGLRGVDNLAGVWAWRLHPANLPMVPGQKLDPGLERAGDHAVPSTTRIAEIRELHGVGRGSAYTRRMGGAG